MTDFSPAQRHVQRHNQISIRLHYALDSGWHRIEAQQWNERGFCIFHTHALPLAPLQFKRSLQHFQGELVWSRVCNDEAQVLEMLLNEAIHVKAQAIKAQPDTRQRLLRLMRVQGMVDAKQQVLTALGGMPTPAQWQARVQARMQASLFQSGVRVESPVWNSVIAEALTLGAVVQDLERWSGALSGI